MPPKRESCRPILPPPPRSATTVQRPRRDCRKREGMNADDRADSLAQPPLGHACRRLIAAGMGLVCGLPATSKC
jgi:hypothetical protein